jgi:glycosyltransferase involved in cell wall biosynthesis
MKIAIVDCIGLNYDGSTLTKKGIGGSESSIISISRELVKLGFSVSVFNDCNSADTSPGTYDGVDYYPISALGVHKFNFDIVISQRTVIPFTPLHLYNQVVQPPPRNYDPSIFAQLQRPEQLKIIWMQDTFIWGDHILETLIIHRHIDKIFCISDWHIAYTANATHGPRRNFEVLKKHIFNTRNAINRWIDWVDVKAKDPNLFVYNASITKGMEPLIKDIWPKIRARHPEARLKIIGGYYKFRDEQVSEAQAKVIALQELTQNDPSIEFTGIIPQPEIAKIMAKATYNLYPGAYPETSGISSIESINYNTPIIGVRFGAMEESATDQASYFIDYAIEPNSLFPWINKDLQIQKYVDLVDQVISNPYLHQQKQYACNAIKDVSTWDTVALQWKQHFYNIFDVDMDPVEEDQVDWINYRVQKVFGRRFSNAEDILVSEPTVPLAPLPAPKVKVAIIDIVGMSYDGDTLNRKGLGGSESAVILNSRELAKIGFDVTVFNACDEDDSSPGVYDGVIYRPLSEIANSETFDIVISSRVVTPFVPEHYYAYPQSTNRKIPYPDFKKFRDTAKLKVFWMHDTFCWGDDILEDLVTQGAIDEVWTLSDFHTMYVMNCSHPRMRSYEVLRKKIWTTRNGIVKYFDSVDTAKKDPNLMIFNANMSKGLEPLLNDVWPKVKERLPEVRLTVIGGHYKLGAAFANNDEESEFMKIVGPHLNDPSITFTGIISQRAVAEINQRASFFIYPASLPETYGISTLEALYANTPLLTCRFGALEETAGPYSYFIDYAIQPNGLFPQINKDHQVTQFVDMVERAYRDPKLVDSFNELKDLVGWDVVALEWKQHIYSKLGLYLSRGESQQALYTKNQYQKIFNRRFSTTEQCVAPKQRVEQRIVVISPFYNAKDYIEKCISSVAAQDYDNYVHLLIDDASTDNGYTVALDHIQQLPEDIRSKFFVVRNSTNQGAVFNHIETIRSRVEPDDIVVLLDGDDSLVNRPDIFTYYNRIHYDYDFTYGSCWSMVDSIPLIGQPYPPEVKASKDYKSYKFNWNMPYTHLRTLKGHLLLNEPESKFQDADGRWLKAGGDNATFYTALENCDSGKVYAVSDIVYNYNDINPLNDYKVNREQQDRAIAQVLNKPKDTRIKRILIAIPTNRNIEAVTFKSIYDLIIPEGYIADFQYFWGYQVDQVRNLIANWTMGHDYDYLFSVDSDISFPPDTLAKLLVHDKDIVSGIYIQRIPGTHTIEIMRKNEWGGVTHVEWNTIKGQGLVPIDGCGFGCVLVKTEVFRAIPYPHFLYHSAIDHANTLSEDVHFCNQARDRGFTLWADTSVICDHTGSWTFTVDK